MGARRVAAAHNAMNALLRVFLSFALVFFCGAGLGLSGIGSAFADDDETEEMPYVRGAYYVAGVETAADADEANAALDLSDEPNYLMTEDKDETATFCCSVDESPSLFLAYDTANATAITKYTSSSYGYNSSVATAPITLVSSGAQFSQEVGGVTYMAKYCMSITPKSVGETYIPVYAKPQTSSIYYLKVEVVASGSTVIELPDDETVTYTGSAVEGIAASNDYTVVYTDQNGAEVESPTDVGTYTATCTLTGDDTVYWRNGSQDTYEATLTIAPVTLTATLSITQNVYEGQTPEDVTVDITYSGWLTDSDGNAIDSETSVSGFEAPTPVFYETVTSSVTDDDGVTSESTTTTQMSETDTFKESTETETYSYTVELSGGNAGSTYEFAYADPVSIVIGAYTEVQRPDNIDVVYDGLAHEVVSSAGYTIVYSDSDGNELDGVPTNAGTYTAVCALNEGYCWSDGNDKLATHSATVVIEKKQLYVVLSGTSTIEYGSTLNRSDYVFTYKGFVTGEWYEDDEDCGLTQAAGYTAPSLSAVATIGTKSVSISGGSADNYEFSCTSTATVTVEGIKVDYPEVDDVVYDGEWNFYEYYSSSYGSLMSTDDYTTNMTGSRAETGMNAGTYVIYFTLNTGRCWSDGATDDYYLTVSITPAELTATPADQTIEEGSKFDASLVEVTGFVNGETAETVDGYVASTAMLEIDGEIDDEADGSKLEVGEYTLVADTTNCSATNYSFVAGSAATLTVVSPAASEEETSSLSATVSTASEELSSLSISTAGDGSDVIEGTAWATAAQYAAIQDAIAAAEAVLADEDATQDDVEAALEALEEALAAVESQTGMLAYTVDTESADYAAGYEAATEAANDADDETSAYSVGYAAGAASASASTSSASLKTQTLTVTTKAKTVKAKKAKKKAVKVKKAVTVKGAKGKVTYAKAGGSKKLTVTKKGVIKVKKGTKKGTYKIKVKVKAAATSSYNAAATVVTVTVKVK